MKNIYLLALCGFLSISGTAHASLLLTIDFQNSTIQGAPGTVLQFSGTLINTSNAVVYLNGDNLNVNGFDPSAIDDSPFFINTPAGFLGPNASTGNILLFTITVPNGFPTGDYGGTYQISGGAFDSDQTIIGFQTFTAQVSNGSTPAPEPSTSVLCVAALAILAIARRATQHQSDR